MSFLTYNQLATLARHFTASVTNKQVADRLGVSPQAVSKALHGKPGMAAVLRAIVELYSDFEVSADDYYKVSRPDEDEE